MITIITGKTKSGKSLKLYEMYRQDQLGDGFIVNRVNKNDKLYGYELIHLSTGKITPFKVMSQYYNFEGYYDLEFNNYRYNSSVFNDVLLDLKHMIKNKVEPIYFDGLGEMELLRKGFDECFLTLLKSHLDLVIALPDKLVRKFIIHYRLSDYKIVSIK